MAAVIYQGSAVKALKDILRMKTGTELITGDSDDPTSVAKDAPIGSIYLRSGTSELYRKLDSGSSTNWELDSVELQRAVKLGLSTGLIEGGVISINGGNPAQFDITAGSGVVVDPTNATNPSVTFVSWISSTGNSVTSLASEDDTQVGYNAAGSLQQFTPIRQSAAHATRRDVITLGVLLHFSRTQIDDLLNVPASYIQNDAAIHADLSTAIGGINRAGNEYTNDGASLRIVKSEGETYVTGINFRNNPKNPNFQASAAKAGSENFIYVWRDGSGGFNTNSQNTINGANYDDGTGGTGTPNGNTSGFQNQRIYLLYTGATVVVYGQTLYGSLAEAIDGIQQEKPVLPAFLNYGTLRTILSVKDSVSTFDLSNPNEAQFSQAGKFGEAGVTSSTDSTTNLTQAYQNSVSGELTLNSTKAAFKVRDNSTPLSTTLFEVTDNAGTTPYLQVTDQAVTAAGLFKLDNLQLDGNTLSSTNTNGDIILKPNGTGNVDAQGDLILANDATQPLQATTKQQLDAAINGIQRKLSCKVATTGNITLSGEQTIDGVLTSANRVLVKNQTTQSENGIYVSDAGAWSRAADANTSAELNHAITSIESGTANSDTAWEQTTDNPNVGVDNIVWAQAYGAGTYTASELGIKLIGGSQFQIDIDGTTLSQSASGLRVAALGITDAEVATAAAITRTKIANGTADHVVINNGSGTLSSEAQLAITRGGTGQSTATAAFDALAPTTTKGDIIVNNGSDNIRVAVGSDGQVLTADSGQASGVVWSALDGSPDDAPYGISNMGIGTSVAASALTVALKQSDGSTDPAGGSPVDIIFRSSTKTTGSTTLRQATAATSVVVPSGATLGHANNVEGTIYVYAIDNAGTIEMAVSSTKYSEGSLQSTTAISAAADDSGLYSTSARTDVPIRLLGRLKSTQTTAGTWAANVEENSLASSFLEFGDTGFKKSTSTFVTYPGVAGQWQDLTSLQLDPGEWEISASWMTTSTGVTTADNFNWGISTTAGDSATGLTLGDNRYVHRLDNTAASIFYSGNIPVYRVVPASTTTYYFKSFLNQITNRDIAYKMTARRVK